MFVKTLAVPNLLVRQIKTWSVSVAIEIKGGYDGFVIGIRGRLIGGIR